MLFVGNESDILTVDADGNQIPEDLFLESIRIGQQAIQPLIKFQSDFAALHGKQKRKAHLFVPSEEIQAKTDDLLREELLKLAGSDAPVAEKEVLIANIRRTALEALRNSFPSASAMEITSSIECTEQSVFRRRVLEESKRSDSRQLNEIRPIRTELAVLPDVVHGSALFERGLTQALASVTIDSPDAAQPLAHSKEPKRFMCHYEFPPYSVNEIGRIGRAGRRDIGHGQLVERALAPMFPPKEEFPFTVRVSAEVTSSNGSSSMASICAGSLALMDAGIPLPGHVAGVTCGLTTELDDLSNDIKRYRLLTDIAGIEDHLGDMDLKIAGTRKGINVCQLDVKIPGLPYMVLAEAVENIRLARLTILDKLEAAIPTSRLSFNPSAPLLGLGYLR